MLSNEPSDVGGKFIPNTHIFFRPHILKLIVVLDNPDDLFCQLEDVDDS